MTGEDLKAFTRDLAIDMKTFVNEYLKKTMAPVLARIEEQERRIKDLEQREYQGVWASEDKYQKGAWVTHQGGIWHSNMNDNKCRPGLDPASWTLCVKSGRDIR